LGARVVLAHDERHEPSQRVLVRRSPAEEQAEPLGRFEERRSARGRREHPSGEGQRTSALLQEPGELLGFFWIERISEALHREIHSTIRPALCRRSPPLRCRSPSLSAVRLCRPPEAPGQRLARRLCPESRDHPESSRSRSSRVALRSRPSMRKSSPSLRQLFTFTWSSPATPSTVAARVEPGGEGRGLATTVLSPSVSTRKAVPPWRNVMGRVMGSS